MTTTTTTTPRTDSNGQSRKTLASQLDRLDGILDGLDAALAGAVQEAVEQAVKQAVQAVLTEVLTNRELQEQLQQAAQPAPPAEEPRSKKNTPNRLWQAATEGARQHGPDDEEDGPRRRHGRAGRRRGDCWPRLCRPREDCRNVRRRVPPRQAAGPGSHRGSDELLAVVRFGRLRRDVERRGWPGRSIALAARRKPCRSESARAVVLPDLSTPPRPRPRGLRPSVCSGRQDPDDKHQSYLE